MPVVSPPLPTSVKARQSILPFALLAAAGLAGNYFAFTFFLDIQFFTGSILALLALQFMGPGMGCAVAAVAGTVTCLNYGHPFVMLLLVAEVASVWFLVARRNITMVLADTCYWLLAGIPAIYLMFHLALQLPYGSTTMTMAKLTVNGIANALLARMLFMGWAAYSRSVPLSYREIVQNLFSLFVLLPSLVILAVSSRADFMETERAISTSLNQDSQRIDKLMETWALNRKQNLTVLAQTLSTATSSEMRNYLLLATSSDPSFKQIALMDANGEVVAFYPPPRQGESSEVGLNLADRRYLPLLRASLTPILSDVSFSWNGSPRPRVAVLAPVVKKGRFAGYVCGVITLQQTRTLLDKFTEHTEKIYTLSDKNGRVIMTNRPAGTGTSPSVENTGAPPVSLLGKWRREMDRSGTMVARATTYRSKIVVGELGEWTLTLEQPAAPFRRALYAKYTERFTLLLLVLIMSLGLAEFLSRRIMKNLEQLLQVTRALPSRLASGATVSWPETSVFEASYLIGNFKEMADSLQDQFKTIQAANETLARQTTLLQESEEKYRLLFDSANDAIIITDIGERILEANPLAVERLGYTRSELTGMCIADVETNEERRPREDPRERLLETKSVTYETVYRRKDGAPVSTEVSARLIQWGDRPVVLSICRDITERKRAYQARVIAMSDLISAIAHQWRQPLSTLGMIIQRTHALGSRQELSPEYLDEFKANAMRQIRYMSETIDEFRDFYRPDKERQEFSPAACIEESLKLLEAQFAHHGIEVQLIREPGSDLLVRGGGNEFKQVMLNLLGNARDAIQERRSKEGGPDPGIIRVTVASRRPGMLNIEVNDNGCGVSEETAPRLFAPYFTTKKESGGTGIGLYLSRTIIEESIGGTLRFVPDQEMTTFHIELPTGNEP